MDKTLRTILITTLAVVLAGGLFLGGIAFAGLLTGAAGWYGPGMMGGGGCGMTGNYGPSPREGAGPISIDDARSAVEDYLARYGGDDLAIEEIMVFKNNAYAVVVEESTGVGAFELLVDPAARTVYPEYGPNMMWNLKYGMMGGAGGMMGSGGMMGGYSYGSNADDVSAAMPVGPDQALANAQQYLDSRLPGEEVTDEITAFYGYYTIDTARGGKIAGMLSVNGFTGRVFYHTWHGEFVEMRDY